MIFKLKKYIATFVLLTIAVISKGAITLNVTSSDKEYYFNNSNINCILDTTDKLTINDVIGPEYQKIFSNNEGISTRFLKANKTYWIKLNIKKSLKIVARDLAIEFFDFRISHLDFFYPDKNGRYLMKTVGFSYPFSTKEFDHKNYVFKLPAYDKENFQVYARIKSNVPIVPSGRVISVEKFTKYALAEYFLLSIFYGICLSMILYNLFLYVTIRDVTYVYYILYVSGAALFSFSRDGLGFQYIWPNLPFLNSFIFNFSNLFMIFWLVLYARSFLNTAEDRPGVDKILKYLLITRILIYFITSLFFPEYGYQTIYDIATLLLIFYAGIRSFKMPIGQVGPGFYYLLAFMWMLLGYSIYALTNIGIVESSVLTSNSVNFGLIGEMLFLSFALAARIKVLQREKIKAQKETIKQLIVNEELKDSLNKDLEQKVKERTNELETKNKELDAFVYKASHDLKGPLNSIAGLATIGMMESNTDKMKEYFKLTKETTQRLQATIADLLSLTKVKETTIAIRPLNIYELIDEVVDNFAHDENYKEVTIQKNIEIEKDVISDESLMKSILQNLVENGLKYRDPRKETQKLDIFLRNSNGHLLLKVSDNGIGVPDESKLKIFDMFYKINPKSAGSGLGLHILKTAVDKLGGVIEVESERGKGTTFTINIPNK